MKTPKTPAPAVVLGHNVRKRREALGLAQEELARASRLTAAALSRIENAQGGSRGVGLARIERLARALRCQPGDLLTPSP
jgi:transcriptional regulator with XRE-family HTH domain